MTQETNGATAHKTLKPFCGPHSSSNLLKDNCYSIFKNIESHNFCINWFRNLFLYRNHFVYYLCKPMAKKERTTYFLILSCCRPFFQFGNGIIGIISKKCSFIIVQLIYNLFASCYLKKYLVHWMKITFSTSRISRNKIYTEFYKKFNLRYFSMVFNS